MSKRCVVLAAALVTVLAAPPARAAEPAPGAAADASLEILRSTIRANRNALVAVNLTLTDDEAEKFWPLYEKYQQDLRPIQDRFVGVIKDYIESFDDLSNEKAMALIEAYLAAEADRLSVRRSYLGQFAAVLPGRKAARFYQIENKMDAVLRYDLAAEIPVVEE